MQDLGTDSFIEEVTLATLGVKHNCPACMIVQRREEFGRGGQKKRPWFSWRDEPVAIQYPAPQTVSIAELRRRYYSTDYAAAHPHDPLVQIKRALLRRRQIARYFSHGEPLADAQDLIEPTFRTCNSKLAACLYALGVQHSRPVLETNVAEAVIRCESKRVPFVLPSRAELATDQIASLWHDRDFIKLSPNHPVALLRWAMINWDATLEYVNKILPHVAQQDVNETIWIVQPRMTADGPRFNIPAKLPA